MWKKINEKQGYIAIAVSIIFAAIIILCIEEIKWKLLLLANGMLLLINGLSLCFADLGLKKCASVTGKIYKVFSILFIIVGSIVLLGCIFGSIHL